MSVDKSDFDRMIEEAGKGALVRVHAIGDGSVRAILDVLERARELDPGRARKLIRFPIVSSCATRTFLAFAGSTSWPTFASDLLPQPADQCDGRSRRRREHEVLCQHQEGRGR